MILSQLPQPNSIVIKAITFRKERRRGLKHTTALWKSCEKVINITPILKIYQDLTLTLKIKYLVVGAVTTPIWVLFNNMFYNIDSNRNRTWTSWSCVLKIFSFVTYFLHIYVFLCISYNEAKSIHHVRCSFFGCHSYGTFVEKVS